jgi:hypothetical protein
MAAFIHDRDFWQRISPLFCTGADGEEINDFLTDGFTAIFLSLRKYRTLMGNSVAAFNPTEEFMSVLLSDIAGQAKYITHGAQVEMTTMFYMTLLATPLDPATKQTAEAGWPRWLEKKRLRTHLQTQLNMTTWDPAMLMAHCQDQHNLIRARVGSGTKIYRIGDWMKESQAPIIPLPTGITKLDKVMGGGPAREEAILLIGPQGGGKTIFVCQTACNWAQNNFKGVIITTEQGGKFLEARIVSHALRIPFDKIKRGVSFDAMTADKIEAYHALKEQLDQHLRIIHWTAESGKNIKADLHAAIEAAGAELGGLDFVQFDWANTNAVGIKDVSDAQSGRFLYQMAADHFPATMKKYKTTGVLCVQANMFLAKNKIAIDASVMKECKGMGENFENVIGITARLNGEQNVEGEDIYLEQQYLYVSKCRMGVTQAVPFVRNYWHQTMGEFYNRS